MMNQRKTDTTRIIMYVTILAEVISATRDARKINIKQTTAAINLILERASLET
ncbi:TPA: hypothetical protein RQN69_005513 [Klebsiella michiganensis]|nr:hypothetical protein [Klebsiella michiganensis]